MRPNRIAAAALVLAVAGLGAACFANETLSWDPLAAAKVGDWATYRRLDQGMIAGGNHPQAFLVRVAAVGDKTVTLTVKGPGDRSREVSFQRGEAPELDAIARAFEPHVAAGSAEKVTVKDAKVPVNGKDVEGKIVGFRVGEKHKVTLHVAKDVKVLGVQNLFWDGGLATDGPGTGFELAGQGSAKTTDWGKSFEDLEADLAKKK